LNRTGRSRRAKAGQAATRNAAAHATFARVLIRVERAELKELRSVLRVVLVLAAIDIGVLASELETGRRRLLYGLGPAAEIDRDSPQGT
jgi:hypothetical protein